MELLQLRYFCDAAETQNFSHTAIRFQIPPSAVSQTVKRLEREMGAPLFDRSANRIRLNENGRILYDRASRALALLEEAERQIGDSARAIGGEIRLLVHTNRRLITQVIGAFRERYPDVTFLLDHQVKEGFDRYDLIISDEPFPFDRWDAFPLVTEHFCLAVARDHPLANAEEISPVDLREESFVSMREDSSLYRTTRRICLEHGFEPRVTIQCDDPYSVRQYVAMNLGITLFPAVSWEGLFSEQVRIRPIGPFCRTTYFRQRKNGYHSRAVTEFLSFLEQRRRL